MLTHICIRIHMHTNAHAHAWHCRHTEALTLRPTIYAQICTHIHIYMYINAYIYIYIHTCIHIHIYMSAHIHTYTYIHTHTKCTYARPQARLERRRSSDRARSWCRRRKPCTSVSFDAIKPHLAPPMLELHCTHFQRHQYPSTPHPLFPTYPRTVRKNGPLYSCRKIRGKAAVQQSPSRWARRTSSPRMTKVTVHGETKGQWGTTKPTTAHHTITTARRPDNIRSSALVRGRSTQFMASPCRWPQRRYPVTRLHFRHFRGLLPHDTVMRSYYQPIHGSSGADATLLMENIAEQVYV